MSFLPILFYGDWDNFNRSDGRIRYPPSLKTLRILLCWRSIGDMSKFRTESRKILVAKLFRKTLNPYLSVHSTKKSTSVNFNNRNYWQFSSSLLGNASLEAMAELDMGDIMDHTNYLVTFIFEGIVLLIVALVGLVGNLASFITIFSQKVQKTFHSLLFLLTIFDMVRRASLSNLIDNSKT